MVGMAFHLLHSQATKVGWWCWRRSFQSDNLFGLKNASNLYQPIPTYSIRLATLQGLEAIELTIVETALFNTVSRWAALLVGHVGRIFADPMGGNSSVIFLWSFISLEMCLCTILHPGPASQVHAFVTQRSVRWQFLFFRLAMSCYEYVHDIVIRMIILWL